MLFAPHQPTCMSQTKWEGPYLDKDVPLDPWGKPYHYRCQESITPSASMCGQSAPMARKSAIGRQTWWKRSDREA